MQVANLGGTLSQFGDGPGCPAKSCAALSFALLLGLSQFFQVRMLLRLLIRMVPRFVQNFFLFFSSFFSKFFLRLFGIGHVSLLSG